MKVSILLHEHYFSAHLMPTHVLQHLVFVKQVAHVKHSHVRLGLLKLVILKRILEISDIRCKEQGQI